MKFEAIKSRPLAEDAVRQGHLSKVLLLPAEFGGTEVLENITYVPVFIKHIKDKTTAELLMLAKSGSINVSIVPEYRGASFVPTKLLLSAWRDGHPVAYKQEINIW